MDRALQPWNWLKDRAVTWAPRMGVWVARNAYFWGRVAWAYLVRRGVLRQPNPIRREVAMPVPPSRSAPVRAPAVGHA